MAKKSPKKKAAPKKTAKKKAPVKKAAKKKAAPKAAPKKKVAKKKAAVAPKKKVAKKVVKKAAPKKAASKKKAATQVATKKAATKPLAEKPKPKKKATAKARAAKPEPVEPTVIPLPVPKLTAKRKKFLAKQKAKLLELRDELVDAMEGVVGNTIRGDGDSSAFGMHQADAGSDAYDRDFALSLLSQEQDAFQEIELALKRVEDGTYGVCEVSRKEIPELRMEAIPFARLTVECQSEFERQMKLYGNRARAYSAFGLEGSSEENSSEDSVDD
ncbi:MAG: TraR/DksA family transcriptional regulator [Verrucomicrobiota bacterium]